MRKYVFENATVYISEPTEAQKENIRKSTERFVQQLAKRGMLYDEQGRNNSRIGGANINARKRDSKIERKNHTN